MALNVRLSDRARADIEEIAEYLEQNWSAKVKMDFLIGITDKMEAISEMPHMCRESANQPGVRECVVNKHIIIYYRIVDNRLINVLSIRNTRRNNS
ncbi:addiction module RelE/StbE family toxin [Dyadobacter sp. BE34]|uniref:Addiction module RelE/StbE family toxin n=1 Tax=Dyadobacter fermentans TaxID=94254 RepID=A0ABU1R2P6_9BACT|nr:addiction module RelE/StbE family toxin [Dyadobacter fermentans]MDR7045435.1 addiction module RelE/StbE family toxin [Dyadobacter sp. BE242]MDR7199748.1 addiction module RelE/StbE family toxin [Dyadobacter sp. BE34]MDR7217793.1 addiction module RelE/StbE family toxin [Dyadobacter sp. BE31]MDR7265639.1 addiction module RelE/StbE family toxin [Dyadobacter sp. BE32]